jgi:hypothetical protein
MKVLALPLVLALVSPALSLGGHSPDKEKRASISLKASPAIAFSPARVVVTADIKGGTDDLEEFYCPAIEWEWGDGTRSTQSADCEPYESGKSEIRRHFTADRVYETSGDYRVELRLKQKDKVIAAGSTLIKIRPGVREIGGY